LKTPGDIEPGIATHRASPGSPPPGPDGSGRQQECPAGLLWAGVSADRRARVSAVFPVLQEALDDAQKSGGDPWQFSIAKADLLDLGLRVTDLRWLVAAGLLSHAAELPCSPGEGRVFRQTSALAITSASCFLLSLDDARQIPGPPVAPPPRDQSPEAPCGICPVWDPSRRELTIRGLMVKRFRTPADCQELILTVFQEEGWPYRIDDPLTGRCGPDGRHRLHDVVRGLNRHQRAARVRFSRDGTGQGVCWGE
jgi:hypothetical protein